MERCCKSYQVVGDTNSSSSTHKGCGGRCHLRTAPVHLEVLGTPKLRFLRWYWAWTRGHFPLWYHSGSWLASRGTSRAPCGAHVTRAGAARRSRAYSWGKRWVASAGGTCRGSSTRWKGHDGTGADWRAGWGGRIDGAWFPFGCLKRGRAGEKMDNFSDLYFWILLINVVISMSLVIYSC